MKLDSLIVLAMLLPQHVVDVIVFTTQIQAGFYLQCLHLLRMLGLLTAAVLGVVFSLLELRDLHKWVISLWLTLKYYRQRCAFV